jgi:hypothetical protein
VYIVKTNIKRDFLIHRSFIKRPSIERNDSACLYTGSGRLWNVVDDVGQRSVEIHIPWLLNKILVGLGLVVMSLFIHFLQKEPCLYVWLQNRHSAFLCCKQILSRGINGVIATILLYAKYLWKTMKKHRKIKLPWLGSEQIFGLPGATACYTALPRLKFPDFLWSLVNQPIIYCPSIEWRKHAFSHEAFGN